ncbi:MAG: CvpA family protein [Cyclobacteriaceae bacterium]|nr:CvpA family protein [Cyclobacteriaceae bacterium]
MALLDIILAALFVLAAVKGYLKGFIVEVFSLVAFFLGIFVAIQFTSPVTEKYFAESEYFGVMSFIVFLVLFIGMAILINLAAKAMKKMVDLTILGMLDNALGALMGVFKWALLISILVWILASLDIQLPQEQVDNSILYPLIEGLGPQVFEIAGTVIPFFHDIFDTLEKFGEKGKIV